MYTPVQGLYAEAVPRQKELFFLFIPYHKSKHSAQMLRGFCPPSRVCGKNHFRICLRAKLVKPLKLFSKFPKVINFTVENYTQCPIWRKHRLTAVGRQINNGEPTMP